MISLCQGLLFERDHQIFKKSEKKLALGPRLGFDGTEDKDPGSRSNQSKTGDANEDIIDSSSAKDDNHNGNYTRTKKDDDFDSSTPEKFTIGKKLNLHMNNQNLLTMRVPLLNILVIAICHVITSSRFLMMRLDRTFFSNKPLFHSEAERKIFTSCQ